MRQHVGRESYHSRTAHPLDTNLLNKTMNTSNLSKIKPKLRTEGRVSGNFGRNKVQAGSQIAELGVTSVKVLNITSRGKYVDKMLAIYNNPPNKRMFEFAFSELHRLQCFEEQRLTETI